MREINIAAVITNKRKEKGMTQDTLAEHMGVTKASVSKWETAQSYPDITLLPQLATFFNISIDELLGYMPQMTKADIRKTYRMLTEAFERSPFEEVFEQSQSIIKKYYACFPLLLQMVVLYMNHHSLADSRSRQEEILKEAIELCERIISESDDVWIIKQANSFVALCYLFLNDAVTVLDRLEGTIKPIISDEMTLANAYLITGASEKAKSIIQVSLYQHLLNMIGMSPMYFQVIASSKEQFEAAYERFYHVAKLFCIDALHPNTMAQFYYSAAVIYLMHDEVQKSIDQIVKYTEICLSIKFPLTLQGDSFFDAIEGWIEEFDLGNMAPRGEKVVKESMLMGLVGNPVFEKINEDVRFKRCVSKIKTYIGGH